MHVLYYCEKCNNLFQADLIKINHDENGNEFSFCPLCIGQYDPIFPIDDWLAPHIKKLNELGFKTRSSCIGSYTDSLNKVNNQYIMFEENYNKIHSAIIDNNLKFEINTEINSSLIINYKCDKNNITFQDSVDFVKEVEKLIDILGVLEYDKRRNIKS